MKREICNMCVEWVDEKDDIPHCTQGFNYDVQQFLDGYSDICPKCFKY